FQNGINNSSEDFRKMGESILKNLQGDEKPLCIGLYNPTEGVGSDVMRLLDRLLGGFLIDNVCCTCEFFSTLAAKLPAVNKELLWAHFAHSEGGLIAKTALALLTRENYFDLFKEHLLLATYGAVLPTPEMHALVAINTYSKD